MPLPTHYNDMHTLHSSEHETESEFFPWLRCRTDAENNDSNKSGLCSLCRQFDFEALFSVSMKTVDLGGRKARSSQFSDGIQLGFADEVQARSGTCAFCKSICDLLEKYGPEGGLPVEYDGHRVACYLSNIVRVPGGISLAPPQAQATCIPFVLQLLVTTKPSLVQEPLEISNRPPPLLIQRLSERPDLGNTCYGRAVSRSGIDFRLVSRWIQSCTHNTVTTTTTVKPKLRLTLIDVDREALVAPVEAPEYVALSYVWGQIKPLTLREENESEFHVDGSLSIDNKEIPQTIRDAMLTCRKLGERFLWVDSLCIMQDSRDKHDLIRQMDLVYQRAKLTIIAAHGTDAGAGLPGVREGSRPILQHIAKVRSMRLANVLPGLDSSVDSTFWNTRAWTYQERLLSARRLYFTKNQVFFECNHGEFREDMSIDPHAETMPGVVDYGARSGLRGGTGYRIVSHKTLNLDIYDKIISEYTSRSLSYQEDILNALQGVTNILSRDLFNNSPFVFGIPLCLLDLGLLWQPAGLLRRRCRSVHSERHFPSWSWTGWVGRFETDWWGNISERTISRAVWLNTASPNLPIERECTGNPNSSWTGWDLWKRNIDANQVVYYTRKGGEADKWFCHPILDQVDCQSSPLNLESGYLNLRAEIAQLTVNSIHSLRKWSQSPTCEEGIHEKCELSVFDSDGVPAGIVYVDGNTFRRLQPGRYNFVKLSQTTLAHADSDPAWDEETESYAGRPGGLPLNHRPPLDAEDEIFDQTRYDLNICWCLYNVLMVEWQDGVAYRIGIGQVHIHAFDAASPKWHKMMLG